MITRSFCIAAANLCTLSKPEKLQLIIYSQSDWVMLIRFWCQNSILLVSSPTNYAIKGMAVNDAIVQAASG